MILLTPRLPLIALIISVIVLNSGCRKDGGMFCEKGKGSTITETRSASGFTRVNSEIDATLYVSQGPAFDVKVEAQGNLMDNIKTETSGGELRIYAKHCMKKYDPIKIYVTSPTVEGIALDGSGAIYTTSRIDANTLSVSIAGSGAFAASDSIIANYCQVSIAGSGNATFTGRFGTIDTRIAGSGNIMMKGRSEASDIDISGSGDIHAYDLPVKTCSVTVSGSGNAEVNASEQLDVSISGSGDVFYKGAPTVSVSTSGSGSIQHVP